MTIPKLPPGKYPASTKVLVWVITIFAGLMAGVMAHAMKQPSEDDNKIEDLVIKHEGQINVHESLINQIDKRLDKIDSRTEKMSDQINILFQESRKK